MHRYIVDTCISTPSRSMDRTSSTVILSCFCNALMTANKGKQGTDLSLGCWIRFPSASLNRAGSIPAVLKKSSYRKYEYENALASVTVLSMNSYGFVI